MGDTYKAISEQARLDALSSYQILDSPSEEAFDRITGLAATIFDVPIAAINFIDETRQWSKSKVGLEICEVGRDVSFCTHVLQQHEVLSVPDTCQDERFAANPFVQGEPHIRFYAGAPLIAPGGEVLGTLCLIDSVTRPALSAKERQMLASLAALVIDELELRRESARAQAVEVKLLEEKRLVESILSSLPGIFYILDTDGRMVRWNHTFEYLSGYSAAEIAQMHPTEFFEAEEQPRIAAEIGKVFEQGEASVTAQFRSKGGALTPHLFTGRRFEFAGGLYLIGMGVDMTEQQRADEALRMLNERLEERSYDLERANERLAHDACHDALTGLPNRAFFAERLTQAMQRQKRNPEDAYAVLFLDFDRFKIINDSLGHAVGDALLVEAARRLRASVRAVDTVARLGGDEFTVLLDKADSVADASQVAEHIQENLAAPYCLAGHELNLSVSIGIVMAEPGHVDAGDVLRDADIAMYRAKELGKATSQVFDRPMRERAAARLTLERDLREALQKGEFEVHYQPIFELGGRRITGFEALVRRRHPVHGLISPADFIPIAEDTGLIVELDRLVLAEACQQMRRWRDETGQPLDLSVNLSSQQFERSDFLPAVEKVLKASGFPAERLHLEITESLLLNNAPHTHERLSQLRALGIALHIDDFGTGYSSLSYLERLDADTLKIDRSFIGKMLQHPRSSELVKTIISLAHTFGMSVVAEGVETEAQLAYLRSLSCDYAQGYLLSKPLPPERAIALIEEKKRASEGHFSSVVGS